MIKYLERSKFILLMILFLLISCGKNDPDHKMVINEKGYVPTELTVEVGNEVSWINKDDKAHTVSSGVNELWTFDSGEIEPGTEFSFKFMESTIGSHTYYCKIHGNEEMEGIIIVKPKGY